MLSSLALRSLRAASVARAPVARAAVARYASRFMSAEPYAVDAPDGYHDLEDVVREPRRMRFVCVLLSVVVRILHDDA